MGRRNRAVLLGNNLPQLQNLIKRDPESYKEEFLQQYRHFESSLSLFELKPDAENKELGDLIMFLSQVVKLYQEQAKVFPNQLIELLTKFHMVLCPDLRKSIVQSLILLKNKGVIESMDLLSLFFTLFRCKDKLLREILYTFIINDIKDANSKHKDNRLNKTLQNFLYSIFQKAQGLSNNSNAPDGSENVIAAKKSLQVCIELYRKNIWNDKKTVNVIAEACLSPIGTLVFPAAHFFLGNNETEDSDDEDEIDIRQLDHQSQINKKTKARARKREKAVASLRRRERKGKKAEVFNFSALHLINDPQGFAEKLFARLNKAGNEGFELKLILMKLIARVIGIHKLILLGFYPYLIKYIQPHQRDVTQILALTAQSCHEIVPPETLEPLLSAITKNFVSENMSNEVISAGINSIREICARAPLIMNEDLLQDLTEYKKIKDKSVVMASRSLIQLFREINPSLLKKKDRGRDATVAKISGNETKVLKYGEIQTAEGISGIEYLESSGSENDDDDEEKEDVENDEEEDDEEDEEELEDDEEELEDDEEELEDDEEELEEGIDNVVDNAEDSKEEEKVQKKVRVDALRILTDEDFKLIKKKQRNVSMNLDKNHGIKRKSKAESDSEDDSQASDDDKNDEVVDESAITRFHKKAKQDYQQRMESIQAGREGRAKFGSNFSKKTDKHSTTNRQKKRGKNFLMVAHKKGVLQKSKMSLRDKQTQLRTRIEKQKKRKH
ncbi:SDA1-domain-containing protein [Neoconidiobolus thromboides FSU 785]|nr:SDA1-domain-containing protein [Neoconidiobolus thromboides FSU 785]